MFNFASKLINTIGDLVSVEEPPKPQPSQQSQSLQRRASGDARIFQQQKPRFFGPGADDSAFRGGSGTIRNARPSTSVYRYPSTGTTSATNYGPTTSTATAAYGPTTTTSYGPSNANYGKQTSTVYGGSSTSTFGSSSGSTNYGQSTNYGPTSSGYRADRYEENKFKSPDIDYNEDGYSVGGNVPGNERSSYVTEIQKDYGIYREHDNNDSKDYEDEDRYSPNYEDSRRKRSVSDSDNTQMKNSNNCDNSAYMNVDRNYYSNRDDQHSFQAINATVYENRDHQFFSNETFNTLSNTDTHNFSVDDLAQFNTNSWLVENNYTEERWRTDEVSFEGQDKSYNDDKTLPLSPTQEEDAKNSSRSESESSDEISFGEALATGLIPPHITPEIAARMNIELINHPKAVIESFYGHSPGEVYTIPEEEDEICSPTGADGVTSLRKQRMASARVETSANVPQDLLSKRRNMPSNQCEQKQRYGPSNLDSSDKSELRSNIDESKGMRLMKNENDNLNVVQKLQPNLTVKFHADQGHNHPMYRQQPFDMMQTQSHDRLNNQQTQQTQPQEDPRLLSQNKDTTSQKIIRTDGRQNSVFYSNNQQSSAFVDNRQSQGYSLSSRPAYQYSSENRFAQPHQGDDRTSQPVNFGPRSPQPGPIQMIHSDGRLPQAQPDIKPSQFNYPQQTVNPANRPSQGYPENRSPHQQANFGDSRMQNPPPGQYQHQASYQTSYMPENQQPVPNAYFGDNRQVMYISDNQSCQPGYSENRQSQSYVNDNHPPQGYMLDNRQQFPTYPNERVPQPAYGPTDVRLPTAQVFSGDYRIPQSMPQGYSSNESRMLQPGHCPPENRQHQPDFFPDNRPHVDNYVDNRQFQQGYPPDRSAQPYYQDDRLHQQGFIETQPASGNPRGYPATPENRRLNQPPPPFSGKNSPQRQLPNIGYQQEQQRSGYRELDNQERRTQTIPHAEFSDPNGQRLRRLLPPDRQDSLPTESSNRKQRIPLRKYNSEERYGSQQDEYEKQRYGHAVGDDQHDLQCSSRHQRVKCKGPRQRSLSLDSHERGDHYRSRSSSSSLDRSRDADEFETPNGRVAEPKRSSASRGTSVSSKATQRSPVSSSRALAADRARKTSNRADSESLEETRRHVAVGKESKRLPDSTQRTRPAVDVKRGDNFCPQHKRFTSGETSINRSTRRLLPKEPISSSALRRNVKSQTQDKSTVTSKLEDPVHHRAGILSTAARKVERSGNLKITFSEPISNLLKPNKGTATITRADSSTKTEPLKSDKSVISTSLVGQPKNYVYPLTAGKVSAAHDIGSSPVSVTSPLCRNQSIDSALKDSRLVNSPGARSLPVPVANRTRSLDRYSSSETNLNCTSYYQDQFFRPGSAPGLMYEPVQQPTNSALQLSLYEMHALKKEEKFWSDIYSALPADMKHLIANRGIATGARKISNSNTSFSTTASSTANVTGANHPALENRLMQRSIISRGAGRGAPVIRDNAASSLGERIGNRLRMLHEIKEQAGGVGMRRKLTDSLSRRSASDGEYSFSSATNFPLYWNLTRRPHSDSAIDLLERLDLQNHPPRVSGSAYNSSEFLPPDPSYFKIVDRSQSYLTSPSSNVPPSPAPAHPIRLRDTLLRTNQIDAFHGRLDNKSGFFSCLQNIESLTKQYEEEDRMRSELDSYDDEIYSDSGVPDSECGRFEMHATRRRHFNHQNRRRNHQL